MENLCPGSGPFTLLAAVLAMSVLLMTASAAIGMYRQRIVDDAWVKLQGGFPRIDDAVKERLGVAEPWRRGRWGILPAAGLVLVIMGRIVWAGFGARGCPIALCVLDLIILAGTFGLLLYLWYLQRRLVEEATFLTAAARVPDTGVGTPSASGNT